MASFYEVQGELYIQEASFGTSNKMFLKPCLGIILAIPAHGLYDVLLYQQVIMYAESNVVAHVLVNPQIAIIIAEAEKEEPAEVKRAEPLTSLHGRADLLSHLQQYFLRWPLSSAMLETLSDASPQN